MTDYDMSIEATGSEAKHIIELLQAEAEGRLFILPCKIGQTVYDIEEFIAGTPCPKMYEYKADYICFYNKYPDRETNNICVSIDSVDYSFDDFGRVVFTNKEDAIKAIKENNNGWAVFKIYRNK